MHKGRVILLSLVAAIGVTCTLAPRVFAANAAFDNAADPAYTNSLGNNFSGLNGGTGFAAWVLSPANFTPSNGWYTGSSTINAGGSGGIDTIDVAGHRVAWGGYANSGATSTAVRAFTGSFLSVGQTFRIDTDNGYVESNDEVGVALQNLSGQTLVRVFAMGYASSYIQVEDASGASGLPGSAYTPNGLFLEITLGAGNTYTARITPYDHSYPPTSFSGSLINQPGGEGIAQAMLFLYNPAANNSGPNWDAFFNNMAIFAQAPFGVTAVNVVGGTNTLVSFGSIPGALHELQTCSDLATGSWSSVTNNIVGTGGAMQLKELFSAGQQQRFYRVKAAY